MSAATAKEHVVSSRSAEKVAGAALEFPPETATITYKGRAYTFRELTLGENDVCREAATGPDGAFDSRAMMRQMIVQASVDPELTYDDLLTIPQRFYAQIVDLVNRLNDPDTLEGDKDKDEDPGNS